MSAIEVSAANFDYWLPRVQRAIDDAVFVSLDLEFLGLPSALHGGNASLFDTPADRYRKFRRGVERFPPCQLGLACFHEDEELGKYQADVFSFTLFKRVPQKEFSISPAAVSFLAEHGFDFNKFAIEGINYSNRGEIDTLRSGLSSDGFDFDVFGSDFNERVRWLKAQLLLEIEKNSYGASDIDRASKGVTTLRRPILIELYREEEDFQELEVTSPWTKPLSSLEEEALLYFCSKEYPDLEFLIDNGRTLLYVGKLPLIYGGGSSDAGKRLEALLTEISGVCRVFEHLFTRKPPLVGHNCLLDLLYIYHCFVNNLTESYDTWKSEFHRRMPVIVDTRFLAGTLEQRLASHKINDFSLTTLGDFFTMRTFFDLLPFAISMSINGEPFGTLSQGNRVYHNASYDAFVTGIVFLKLAHLYVLDRCSVPIDKPWSVRKLLIACRGEVTNRIPIGIIDAKCCNMGGPDARGSRPDIVKVRRSRTVSESSTLFSAVIDSPLVRKMSEKLHGSPAISPQKLKSVRADLVRLFGAYRVDVRLGAECDILEVATNSPSTYARVCAYFDCSEMFYVVEDNLQTFEQRLCSARVEKDAVTANTPSASLSTATAIVVIVFSLPPLAWGFSRLMRL
ncbi:hypothetical protein Q1695_003422 [Nippostrongylus brasiliensis]|nr:hypothetical protein Q1695_003422 [Nippostrongylus brasiliensis]